MSQRRPSFMPEVREFSQADPRVVQRPEGIDALGTNPVTIRDIENGTRERYSDLQVTPGRYDEAFPLTAVPQLAAAGGTGAVLIEKDLGFTAHGLAVDNWTNQWLYEPNMKRFIPPYSGGWIYLIPRGYQMARVYLRAPAAYTLQVALAAEFVFLGWHEASLPPQSGIITTVKAVVTA
jgi:hypothetical protein